MVGPLRGRQSCGRCELSASAQSLCRWLGDLAASAGAAAGAGAGASAGEVKGSQDATRCACTTEVQTQLKLGVAGVGVGCICGGGGRGVAMAAWMAMAGWVVDLELFLCVSLQPHCKADESLLLSRLHRQLKAARSLIAHEDGRFSHVNKAIELSASQRMCHVHACVCGARRTFTNVSHVLWYVILNLISYDLHKYTM